MLDYDANRSVIVAAREVAIQAARTAGEVLLYHTRHGFRIEHKNPINLVTDADRAAEASIIATIRETFPTHRVLAEEGGGQEIGQETGQSPFRWVIDPLDGTTNFAHGFPAYCVSIGLEHDGQVVLGVVWDPTRSELFEGERGRGATLNGIPIGVSKTETLLAALLVTGFAYDIRENADNNLDHFTHFALKAQGIRRTGTAALDLCYVACGRFDGFWELKLHPWDSAAGSVIVQEAGGRISDFSGHPYSIYGEAILASNGLIHEQMRAVLTGE
jgi:myo-inositol-1(or 4)-monophosphatase